MKGVFKRLNSQFYQIRYRGLDGRIMRKSSGTTKLREAQTLLHKRKSQIDAGKQPGVKSYVNQLHVIDKYGAGEGARTPDPNLGKVVLYH